MKLVVLSIFALLLVQCMANNGGEVTRLITSDGDLDSLLTDSQIDPCAAVKCQECHACQTGESGEAKCVKNVKCMADLLERKSVCHRNTCNKCETCVPNKRRIVCVRAPCPNYRCIRNPLCLDFDETSHCSQLLCTRGTSTRVDGKCQCVLNDGQIVPTQPSRCSLPKVVGPCRALIRSWYYNSKTGVCEQFNYGGCRGNKNRFATKDLCENKCAN